MYISPWEVNEFHLAEWGAFTGTVVGRVGKGYGEEGCKYERRGGKEKGLGDGRWKGRVKM